MSFTTSEDALTHGTLGNFIAHFRGDLTVSVTDDGRITYWEFDGSIYLSDTWDFDAKPKGARSGYGEFMTGVARYTLPGEGFPILSPTMPFYQDSTMEESIWPERRNKPETPSRLSGG